MFGRAIDVENPRLVTIPDLVGAAERPVVLAMGKPDSPLFVMGLMNYYRSNASQHTFVNKSTKDGAIYNGGSLYVPKTDSKCNDCFERMFLTVSPSFDEEPSSPRSSTSSMHERNWKATSLGAGQIIRIKHICDVRPGDNSCGDWA